MDEETRKNMEKSLQELKDLSQGLPKPSAG